MADTAINLTDPATVLLCVRAAVACLIGLGEGAEAARQVSPAAHLNRLGLAVPDYDGLQQGIKALWGVEIVIPTNARVQDVADAILIAYERRATA